MPAEDYYVHGIQFLYSDSHYYPISYNNAVISENAVTHKYQLWIWHTAVHH